MTASALSEFRGAVATALEGSTPSPADASVFADVVDAVSPPAYMLQWSSPWLEPSTFCYHVARLDIICIAGRMDPAPGIETVETMIATAINRLRGARLPEVIVQPPARFDIGGVAYLAARLTLEMKLTIPEPDAPVEVFLTVVTTLTVAGVVIPVGTVDGASVMTVLATLTVAGTVIGVPVIDGASTLTTVTALTVAATVVPLATVDGAATLTTITALTVAGTVIAGGFSPADLPGLVGWWDASDTASITASAGKVSQLSDKSGGARHLVQATGTKQPATGTRTQNGLNVLDFDGVDDRLTATVATIGGNTLTAYMVAKNDIANPRRLFSISIVGNDWDNPSGAALGDTLDNGTYYNGAQVVTGAAFGTAAFQYTVTRNGTAWTGRKNATALTGGTSVATNFAATLIGLGSSAGIDQDHYDGIICEVILCTSAHGTTDRDAAETYLRAKWGTP